MAKEPDGVSPFAALGSDAPSAAMRLLCPSALKGRARKGSHMRCDHARMGRRRFAALAGLQSIKLVRQSRSIVYHADVDALRDFAGLVRDLADGVGEERTDGDASSARADRPDA